MRGARGFLVVLLLVSAVLPLLAPPLARADSFTAINSQPPNWKCPPTWGNARRAGSLLVPGLKDGRLDDARIPAGVRVRYEGPGKPGTAAMKLATLTIEGRLEGTSNRTDIKFETTGDIVIGPNGHVGGSSAGVKQSHEISLVSTGGTVNVQGRVEADRKPVTVEGRNGVTVSGVVNSNGGPAAVGSTHGPINIIGGARVTADGNVSINAGPGQPTTIACAVVSRGGNVIINGRKSARPPGNVTVADTVIAAREVIIHADTLVVSGLIKGNTVQKHCKVVIIKPTGRIEGRGSEKDKVAQKQEAKERPPSPPAQPAQQANVIRVTGDPGAVVDLRAAPGAVRADDRVAIAVGPGGTIDLRNNLPLQWVIVCPGPIELAADDILTDPGVPVETLGGPGPVLIQPGRAVIDVGTHAHEAEQAYPDRPLRLWFAVTNLGSVGSDFMLEIGDSLGWPMSLPPPLLSLDDDEPDTLIPIDVTPPPWAQPDADTNRLRLRARSLFDPTVEYEEEIRLPVRDLNELRDVTATPWQTITPAPHQPAHVDWWIMNIGQLDDDYEIMVGDSLNWGFGPPSFATPLPAGLDLITRVSAMIPPHSFPGEVNKVYLSVRSLRHPEFVRHDTVTVTVGETTAIGDGPPRDGAGLRHGCRPNPFNPNLDIWFEMPPPGGQARVAIYDLRGRLVRTLLSGRCEPGTRTCRWDGRAEDGAAAASGTYLYRIEAAGARALGKVVMSR